MKEGYKITITLYPNQTIHLVKASINVAFLITNKLFCEGNYVYFVYLDDLNKVEPFVNEAINHEIQRIIARNKEISDELFNNRQHLTSLANSLKKPVKIK